MPRLLSVHRYYLRKGGAEAAFIDHNTAMQEAGWEVERFVMAHPDAIDHQPDDPTYFAAGAGGLLQKIRDVPRFLYAPEVARKLRAVVARYHPDVVHVHGVYHQLTMALTTTLRQLNVPSVFTAHDFKPICPAHFYYSPKLGVCERCRGGRQWNCFVHKCIHDRWSDSAVYALEGFVTARRGEYRGFDAVVAPSRFVAGKYVEAGFDAAKIVHIPNFHRVSEPSRVAPSHETQPFVFFGRLSREKGCDVLLRALAPLHHPVVFVGDGPERESLAACAAALNVNAHFAGFRQGDELWRVVDQALAIVVPSVWYENAPKSVLEAQARGKVVIASDIGGMPEMITSGETGLLCAPGDVAALSAALTRATAMSAAERATMGEAARRSVQTQFNAALYVERMNALYQRVASR